MIFQWLYTRNISIFCDLSFQEDGKYISEFFLRKSYHLLVDTISQIVDTVIDISSDYEVIRTSNIKIGGRYLLMLNSSKNRELL